jgi:MIP family channel proteins
MNDDVKAYVAELVGTFTLVFIGAGAGVAMQATGEDLGVIGVALAHGIALMVIVYAWGSVSGAHVNPAVTFGIALTGRMPWGKAVGYWIAQLLGAVAAAYLLLYVVGTVHGLGETKGTLTGTDPLKTVAVEAVLTFFLLVAVYASGVGGRGGNAAGAAIGLVLTMDILMGGGLTGASMNPARTLGPAVAIGDLSYVWMYLAGPLIGGGAGALLYNQFLPEPQKAPPAAR